MPSLFILTSDLKKPMELRIIAFTTARISLHSISLILAQSALQHFVGDCSLQVQMAATQFTVFYYNSSRIHRCPRIEQSDRPPHRGLRPLLFSISVWVFKIPHKCCETEPPVYRPSLSEKTRKSNHLQMKHFLLSYLKTLSVGPAGAWTRNFPHGSPALYQLSQPVGGWTLICLLFTDVVSLRLNTKIRAFF